MTTPAPIRMGASTIGLGVALTNARARRLYERLGYTEWGHGSVSGQWTERDDRGQVVLQPADECRYLIKRLGA